MPDNTRNQDNSSDEYYWDYVARTRLGKYITGIESEFISRRLKALPEKPGFILDAGAGSGRHVSLLSDFASWIIATELEPRLVGKIALASDNALPLLVSGTIGSFPVKDNSMDGVVCLEVPYIAEQEWFFAECQRVLKPGGIVIINMTNRFSWKGILSVFHKRRYRYGHSGYYLYSFQTIKKLFREYGFVISSATGLNWIPFKRDSESRLVNFSANLEKILQLRKAVWCSPWVLLEARKIST